MKRWLTFLVVLAAVFAFALPNNEKAATASTTTPASTVVVAETNTGQVYYYAQIRVTTKPDITAFEAVLAGTTNLPKYTLATTETLVTMTLEFPDLKSYQTFTGLDLTQAPYRTVEMNETLFLVERTTTLASPQSRFFNPTAISTLLTGFNSAFNQSGEGIHGGYVFLSNFRRTSVPAADKRVFDPATRVYEYQFFTATTLNNEIVIFDRFANTPMWYVVAVGGAIVVMAGFYLISRAISRNRMNQN